MKLGSCTRDLAIEIILPGRDHEMILEQKARDYFNAGVIQSMLLTLKC